MTKRIKQLELALYKYELELTPKEQGEIDDLIILYCEFNQSWMDEEHGEEEGIKESEFANQILDLVDSHNTKGAKTKTITFTYNQLGCINNALNEKEDLWSSGYDSNDEREGIELGIVNEKGNLIGVLGDIDKKIRETLT
tara:strand:+ start:3187 stop:3606 length:420 start_codon:yes stop_codon:yes gene_type:complete